MTKQEQIETVKQLLQATKELNGEYQDGWQEEIDKGEQLLQHLQAEAHLHPTTSKKPLKPLLWMRKRVGWKEGVTWNDAAKFANIRQCAQYISEYIKYLQSIKQ